MSLFDSVRYLLRSKLRRASAPSYFHVAVTLGIVVYTVTHLIGIADLWLHATTSAVLFNRTTLYSESSPLKTSLAFDTSLCDRADFPPLPNICMTSLDGWAQGQEELVNVGQLVVANASSEMAAITLADENDLAVLVPRTINQLARFKATSFGLRTSCESLNVKCPYIGAQVNCSSIGITVIPTDTAKLVNNLVLVSPFDKWDAPPYTAFSSSSVKYGIAQCCATNPVSTLLQLRWSSQVDGSTTKLNDAIDTIAIPAISLYASCNLTFYNVTLRYDGTLGSKPWQLVPEETVQSEGRFATVLAAPYSWQLVSERLMINVQGKIMQATSVQQAMATINQEISRLALGFTSGGFKFVPATNVEIITPTILGRYPLAPLLTFVILLFVYGLIAIVVFFLSFSTPSDVVIVPPQLKLTSKPKDNHIPALTLAQMRLLTPLPLVSQVFSERSEENADAKSVETSALDMFSERDGNGVNIVRLRLGLESDGIRPRYGIWKSE